MIFIVLTSVCIQISDHYLEQQTDIAMFQVLSLIQKEQFKTNHDYKARFYTIYRALSIEAHNLIKGIDVDDSSDNYDSLNINKERIDLRKQFKSENISAEKYTNKLIDFHRRQSEKFRKDYNKIWESIQKIKPSNWNLIKKACIVLQMIGVCALIFGYSKLLILIQKRAYSGKAKKESSSEIT